MIVKLIEYKYDNMKSIAYTQFDEEYGGYDLKIENGDFKTLDDSNNMKSLINDILTNIMTHKNEISDLIGYDEFGCEIHNIPKELNNSMTQFLGKEYIKESLSSISRIKSIKRINVSELDDNSSLRINILFEAIDNKEYELEYNIII